MADNQIPTTREAADAYEATINVFRSAFSEMKELSKKKSDTTLNEFKVQQINRLLSDIRDFLAEEPERKYLDLLSDERLPQLGDAILLMAQYEGALKGFRERHYGWNGIGSDWLVRE